MVKVRFTSASGEEREVEVSEGTTVMEAARDNGVEGIEGDCGGACACATCHVYVSEEWLGLLDAADDMEGSMLDFASGRRGNSRLGCQIRLTEALDGLRVTTPASQY